MELDILFWLAIAAIYILQSLASKRRQPGGPTPEGGEVPGGARESDLPPDLQEALGEIGRVLRGDPFEPEPLPEPHYEVKPEPARLSEHKSSPARETAPFSDNVVSSPVFYDQAFEEQKTGTFHAPVITHDHEFSFRDPEDAKRNEFKVTRPDLKDQMVSRQAFIAAEVLAPPLSKRGGHR